MLERAGNPLTTMPGGIIRSLAIVGTLSLLVGANADAASQSHQTPRAAIKTEVSGPTITGLVSDDAQDCGPIFDLYAGEQHRIDTIQEMIDFHNTVRATEGLPPLIRDSRLDTSAQDTANFLADQHEMNHVRVPGKAGLVHAGELVPNWQKIGENLGLGGQADDCYGSAIATAWLNSPGHRANIMDPAWTIIGVAAASDGSEAHPGRTFIVAHFAEEIQPDA